MKLRSSQPLWHQAWWKLHLKLCFHDHSRIEKGTCQIVYWLFFFFFFFCDLKGSVFHSTHISFAKESICLFLNWKGIINAILPWKEEIQVFLLSSTSDYHINFSSRWSFTHFLRSKKMPPPLRSLPWHLKIINCFFIFTVQIFWTDFLGIVIILD